jgi:acetyl esterase/lipase
MLIRLTLLLALLLTGCTKFEMLNATVPAWGYARTIDIPYGPEDRQSLDVYVPCGNPKHAPVVLFFYGGYWRYGSKSDYRFVGQALASKGFIAVLPDYRLHPQVTFPAFVEDGAQAVRWTRDHIRQFGGDPDRLYLMGHSAGAHTIALLALDPHYLHDAGVDRSIIKAVSGLAGPYDFVPGPDTGPVFGMTPTDTKADPLTQPIHFAHKDSPPFLLQHGRHDEVVRPDVSSKFAQALQKAGAKSRAIIYPNLGHTGVAQALAWSFRWRAPVLRDAINFFRYHGADRDVKHEDMKHEESTGVRVP